MTEVAQTVIGFPTNTVILIVVAVIGIGAVSWFRLSLTLNELPIAPYVKRTWRWGAALVLGIWLLVRLAISFNPLGGVALGRWTTFAFVAFGLLVGILPLLISPVFRKIVRATPATWIIGIHAVRIVGGLFLPLADMKLLPSEFALPSGYGDVTVAILALVMVYLLATKKPYASLLVLGWNVLGILDFVSALTTGTMYIAPFAAQLAASGASLLYLNFVLIIPSYGVPLVAVLHIYSLLQILSGSAHVDKTKQGREAPVQTPAFAGEPRSINP